MKRVFIKTVIATVAMAAMGIASAQVKTIKFANQNAAGHPIVQGMEKFKEIVEKNSGGKLKVNLFPGGTLGSDQANVSAIQGGSLEMASMNSGIFASQVKEFAIYDFPFMFASTKEADAVVDGAFGKKMHAKLEEKGLIGLDQRRLGEGFGCQPHTVAIPRVVRRVGARCCGWSRKSHPHHQQRQVVRSAKTHGADRSPIQPAVCDRQQEVLGHLERF